MRRAAWLAVVSRSSSRPAAWRCTADRSLAAISSLASVCTALGALFSLASSLGSSFCSALASGLGSSLGSTGAGTARLSARLSVAGCLGAGFAEVAGELLEVATRALGPCVEAGCSCREPTDAPGFEVPGLPKALGPALVGFFVAFVGLIDVRADLSKRALWRVSDVLKSRPRGPRGAWGVIRRSGERSPCGPPRTPRGAARRPNSRGAGPTSGPRTANHTRRICPRREKRGGRNREHSLAFPAEPRGRERASVARFRAAARRCMGRRARARRPTSRLLLRSVWAVRRRWPWPPSRARGTRAGRSGGPSGPAPRRSRPRHRGARIRAAPRRSAGVRTARRPQSPAWLPSTAKASGRSMPMRSAPKPPDDLPTMARDSRRGRVR